MIGPLRVPLGVLAGIVRPPAPTPPAVRDDVDHGATCPTGKTCYATRDQAHRAILYWNARNTDAHRRGLKMNAHRCVWHPDHFHVGHRR